MLSNTLQRQIEWGDCDPAGIVYNPNYFSYFDHCTTMLYGVAGWPKPLMVQTFGIVGCPLVETRAVFKAPCSWGEQVSITSTITDVRNSSFDVHHQLFKDDVLRVEGYETRVWAGREPETGRLKSVPIPAAVVARFRGGN